MLLCVELTSLHVQPPTADPQQIVAHALFSDAAAAVVLLPDAARRTRSCEVTAVTDTTHRRPHDLGRDRPRLPDGAVAEGARRAVAATSPIWCDELLDRHGLTVADVDGWAVHPGGPKILDVVRDRLELPPSALAASRAVLAAARQLLVRRPCS